MDFDQAQQMFREDQIGQLATTATGLRYLKLRSLNRKDHLETLFAAANLQPAASNARAMFREAFSNSEISPPVIDTVIRDIYASSREERREREPELVSQLYRLQVFDWGGLHQNSLEKTIVNNLVLVDRTNFFDSWKLKRAKPLLDETIHSYLDSVADNPGRTVNFTWEGRTYTTLADVAFVIPPSAE